MRKLPVEKKAWCQISRAFSRRKVNLLSDDVGQEGLEQLGVTRQVERDNGAVDESPDKLQNGLSHFRACRELQDVSQCWIGGVN